MPEWFAGQQIERPRIVGGSGDEHLAVKHQGRGFKTARHARLKNPAWCQTRDTRGVDLSDLAVTPTLRILPVSFPIARATLCPQCGRKKQCQTETCHFSPPRLAR